MIRAYPIRIRFGPLVWTVTQSRRGWHGQCPLEGDRFFRIFATEYRALCFCAAYWSFCMTETLSTRDEIDQDIELIARGSEHLRSMVFVMTWTWCRVWHDLQRSGRDSS